jgi:hypothetical protein
MWNELKFKKLMKVLKICIVVVLLYPASFFVVFQFLSLGSAHRQYDYDTEPRTKTVVGPTPSMFIYPPSYCGGVLCYDGTEWPFVVYRPIVSMYIYIYKHWPAFRRWQW